jgi:hypothetical protein
MSLRSVVEIVTHIESFRNVDLYYQGLYFLRFQVYQECPGNDPTGRVYAHPYIVSENYKTYPV